MAKGASFRSCSVRVSGLLSLSAIVASGLKARKQQMQVDTRQAHLALYLERGLQAASTSKRK